MLERAENGGKSLISCFVNLVIYFYAFRLGKSFGGFLVSGVTSVAS